MKRITLLFLALSSLALAEVDVSGGNNPIKDPGSSRSTAGIDIRVSATVIEKGTELRITDTSNNEISSVTFNHELITGNVTGQTQQTLTQQLLIQGNALTEAGNLTGSFETGTLTLTNNDNANTLTSTLGHKIEAINASKVAPLTINSSLTGEAVSGEYAVNTTTYTVTYSKTTTGF